MKKLVLILAALIFALAACAPSQATVPPTATPNLVVVTSAPGEPTETPVVVSPTSAPTFNIPTKTYGANVLVYIDDRAGLSGLFFLLDDDTLIGGPKSDFAGERLVTDIAGVGRKIVAVMYYDGPNDQFKVAQVDGDPLKIWFKANRVLTCTDPCQGEFDYMPGTLVTNVITWYENRGEKNVADALSFWHPAIKNLHACLPSGAKWGVIHYCFREDNLPLIPSITPTPTQTVTNTPTTTPTTAPTPTRTPRP